MKKTILIVVAHSDDETIGMGGTIKKHSENGDKVLAISMTNGVSARNDISKIDIEKRLIASENACKILGFQWVDRFDFPDNKMDSCSMLDIVKSIEEIKERFNPSLVYTHSRSDLNIDHRVVVSAVLTAFRPLPNECCKELRLFEVPSSTDFGHECITGRFDPNLYIDISNTWLAKLKGLKSYSQEIREYPHSRSFEAIENLAKIRGNQVGIKMAEAFQVIRKIEI